MQDCVPFYFCPRSVMLYLIHRGNHPELDYRGGQAPILHFEADLHAMAAWAHAQQRRWAFTLSNAGSCFFEDRCDLVRLDEIDWAAVQARDWRSCKEGKQAEFLVEYNSSWHLIERIGDMYSTASVAASTAPHDVPMRLGRSPTRTAPAESHGEVVAGRSSAGSPETNPDSNSNSPSDSRRSQRAVTIAAHRSTRNAMQRTATVEACRSS